MDIHRSKKPLEGWRDLLKEIGIIVLGVLIALGGEQLVEAMHWRHIVAAEREALTSDARDSLGAPALRAQQQPCVDRRLGELRLVFERHRKGQALGMVGPVSQPSRMSATRGSWEIALAGQALGHMPLREKLEMSNAFGGFDLWDRATLQESQIWERLGALNDAELLTDANWSSLTTDYSAARIVNERMRLLAPFVMKNDNLGIRLGSVTPPAGFEAMAEQICRPLIAR